MCLITYLQMPEIQEEIVTGKHKALVNLYHEFQSTNKKFLCSFANKYCTNLNQLCNDCPLKKYQKEGI